MADHSSNAEGAVMSPALSLPSFRAIEEAARALPPGESGFEINAMIKWQETVGPPTNAHSFAQEAIFVICNSGMKHSVARRIYERVEEALYEGKSSGSAFGHAGKAAAIDRIWTNRKRLFAEFVEIKTDDDRLAFLGRLPWIGEVTKYHLAKNFGVDVAKPDIHLNRIATVEGSTAHDMCKRLAQQTGYRVATVDLILWFACARGIVDSRAPDPFARFRSAAG